MKAYIHVQHLLGTGHVVRAAALGRALAAKGVTVRLCSGNSIPPTVDTTGLELSLLPKARSADAAFSAILDENDVTISDSWKENRKHTLLTDIATFQPDIVITETFPFGRRAFRFELLPLLDQLHALPSRPLIAASIRDILVRKDDPRKEVAMADLFSRYYDMLLVHSDADFCRLEDSFSAASQLADHLHYTGYIHGASNLMSETTDGQDEVIISCGGGAVGLDLLKAGLDAKPRSKARDKVWRLLVGKDIPNETLAALKERETETIIIERARPDFPVLLHKASLSISQAGYNTVLDVLKAGCRALFVPFAAEGETEQTQRAEALQKRGFAHFLPEDDLTPETLAKAIDATLDMRPQQAYLKTDGATVSADLLLRGYKSRHSANNT